MILWSLVVHGLPVKQFIFHNIRSVMEDMDASVGDQHYGKGTEKIEQKGNPELL